uniref:Mitogen-activated protein kinase 15 n=1 Tax=Phocoena sinus TaxID=42100 RepID=A0A8C9CTT9_PHOSS
ICAAEMDRHVAQRYLLRLRLGKGMSSEAYGIVWKAVDQRTGEVVALKKIFDAFKDKTDAQRTFREIMSLGNIVRLPGVIWAENDRDIHLVFESVDTDLNAVICKGTLLKDSHKRYVFHQLLRATNPQPTSFPEPSNVLLDASCSVKLCDFGLAHSLSGLPEGPEGHALTECVATRWYRAPEVFLSSSWYTPGVDMWSLGRILGEMLAGRPLSPRLRRPLPDLLALGAGSGASVVQRLGSRKWGRTLGRLRGRLPTGRALDLREWPLVFAPDTRLSLASPAPASPAPRRFHCPARECTLEADVRLPVHEGAHAPPSAPRLSQMILERRGNGRVPRETGLGGVPTPPVPPLKPRAAAKLPSGSPARKPGRRPRSNPGHGPAHGDPPRQISAPLHQPPPPGGLGRGKGPRWATAGLPSASCCEPAPLPPSPPFHLPSPSPVRFPRLRSLPPRLLRRPSSACRFLPGLPGGRPGRRMFSASASQEAQGAARAALGGCSQAYGTVCHSALGCLPLLPGPRA